MSENNLKTCKHCGTALPKQGIWMSQATIGFDPTSGKPKRRSFYGKTRIEAFDKMNKALYELNTGNYCEPATITLGKWLNDWLEGRKPHIEEETYQGYETQIRVHITPAIGKIKLKDLKTRDIQKLLNDKFKKGRVDGKGGLSPRSVKYIHQTLNTSLNQAVRERIISHNPAEAVELPKKEGREIKTLSTEELKKFFQAAEESPWYTAFLLEFYTGLRRGELLGLRWQDLDFDQGLLKVRQRLSKYKIIKVGTKTPNAKRAITLHTDIMEVLKKHQFQQNEMKQLLGPAYQDNDLIFCNGKGSPLHPDSFTKHYQRFLEKAGLTKTTFHNARHTFATLALESGVGIKTVQEILGHSSISITGDIYSHVTKKMNDDAANKMSRVITGCLEQKITPKKELK